MMKRSYDYVSELGLRLLWFEAPFFHHHAKLSTADPVVNLFCVKITVVV